MPRPIAQPTDRLLLTMICAACCLFSPGCIPNNDSRQQSLTALASESVINSLNPLKLGPNHAAALIFMLSDCPICNSYIPEINRIVTDYKDKRVSFYLIHVDQDLSQTNLQQHAKDYGYICPVFADRDRTLARQLGITIAPEVAVINRAGLAYLGRIDDRYVGFGKKRLQPNTQDLRQALDSILKSEPVATPRTQAIGCAITN
jgi:thiol-disulfide isomerase/thioredoxin